MPKKNRICYLIDLLFVKMWIVYVSLVIIQLFVLVCCTGRDTGDSLAVSYLHWKLDTFPQSKEFSESSQSHSQRFKRGDSNTSDILPDCKAFVTEFSKRASKFIECSVDNARPFRFCKRCVTHYQQAKKVYEDIEENDESLDNCKAILLNSDRVQVINNVQLDIESIWNSADCGKCFSSISEDANGTVHFKLTDQTQQFLQFYDEFTQCIPKIVQNMTYNATVCSNCNKYYVEMNNLFDKLLNDKISPQHVCMDIVDMMNYTRLTWGEQLNCTNVHKEYVAVFVVGACLLTVPLIFYVSLGVYGTKKTQNLMKEKRLPLFEQSYEYGTLDSPTESPDSSNQTEAVIHSANQSNDQQNRRTLSYQTFS